MRANGPSEKREGEGVEEKRKEFYEGYDLINASI